MKELLELAREYFATSAWWPVIRVAAALAILASLVRVILTALPWLPPLLRRSATVLGRWGVVCACACRRMLRDSLTYKHASEPRWVRPLSLVMELVSGIYFALLFSLFFLQFVGFVLYPPAGMVLWKRAVAAAAAGVFFIAGKVFTVQGRDAWVQLRIRWRGRRTRAPLLLPARTGVHNHDPR